MIDESRVIDVQILLIRPWWVKALMVLFWPFAWCYFRLFWWADVEISSSYNHESVQAFRDEIEKKTLH